MSTDLNRADELARLILAGFHSHFSRFQLLTQGAAERFSATLAGRYWRGGRADKLL